MAVVLDATVGGVSANSYCEIAEALSYATTYFSDVDRDFWLGLSADDRTKYLIQATRQMELYLHWEGSKTSIDQALAWPRRDVWDREDEEVPPNIIPQQIKDAECETALWLVQSATKGIEETSAQLSLVKVGPITVDINQTQIGPVRKFFPDKVYALLNSLACFDSGGTPGGGIHVARLVRS